MYTYNYSTSNWLPEDPFEISSLIRSSWNEDNFTNRESYEEYLKQGGNGIRNSTPNSGAVIPPTIPFVSSTFSSSTPPTNGGIPLPPVEIKAKRNSPYVTPIRSNSVKISLTNVANPSYPLQDRPSSASDMTDNNEKLTSQELDYPKPFSPGYPNILNPNYDNRYVKGYDQEGFLKGLVRTTDSKTPGDYKSRPGYKAEVTSEADSINKQQMIDYDTDTFKYETRYTPNKRNDEYLRNFGYEDPLILSFDVQIDTVNSPLFRKENGKEMVLSFLQDYYDIEDLDQRTQLYYQFTETLLRMFDETFHDKINNKNKSYYINSITGVDKLMTKIVNYKEDKITIELNEDVSMISMYLSELYNNLCYSYRNQRYMIPENLLRFILKIKVADLRNFKNSTKAFTIFTLYDCNFNFFESKNFGDELIAAGLNQQMPGFSTLKLDIFYKSINREFYSPIVNATPLLLDTKMYNVYPHYSGGYVKFAGVDQTEGWTFSTNYKKEDDGKKYSADGVEKTVLDKSISSLNRPPDNLSDPTFLDQISHVSKTYEGFNNKIDFLKIANDRGTLLDQLNKEIKENFNAKKLLRPITGLNLTQDIMDIINGNNEILERRIFSATEILLQNQSRKLTMSLGSVLHNTGEILDEFIKEKLMGMKTNKYDSSRLFEQIGYVLPYPLNLAVSNNDINYKEPPKSGELGDI